MMFVMLGGVFFAVLIVMRVGRIGMSFVFVMLVLAVMLFALVRFGRALANCFAGQNFGSGRHGSLRWRVAVRIAVAMAVIVILKIFENVADVQEGVTVETDIDEGGLHSGEDAGDAAFVDATDQREFFFALDINFD
jgi:energy-coupling factor transporter transmembrane protein EcfT